MQGRRGSRELAFQLLYHLELVKGDDKPEMDYFWQLKEPKPDLKPFAEQLVMKVLENRERLDTLLTGASKRWPLGRMDTVSRCLLRLGACEILYMPDTPPQVAINEAVELAKRFGPDESPSFINGILDRLLRDKTPA
jgi:N utilization substance protein B